VNCDGTGSYMNGLQCWTYHPVNVAAALVLLVLSLYGVAVFAWAIWRLRR
jgi:hypothetical protein